MYYFADLIDKTHCIGNSLSTINHDLSSLDLALYGVDTDLSSLSSQHLALQTVVTTKTDYLSSQIISVSSNLFTDLSSLSSQHLALQTVVTTKTDYLSSQIISVSSNLLNTIKTVSASGPSFYQQIIYPTDSVINYNFDTYGSNVKTEISSNLYFDNISNINQGEFGKILLKVYPTSGVSITGWGNQWTFSSTSSTFNFNASAYNLIDYYYSDSQIFAQVSRF